MADDEFVLTSQQKEDAHRTFKLFDKKGNDKVNTKEIGQLFMGCGMSITSEKLEELVDELEDDGSGQIVFEQFLKIFTKKKKEDEDEKELKEAFRVLDTEGKNVIPVDDLRWILRELGESEKITEDEIDHMIAITDVDGSGTVDYDEFRALMMG